MFLEFLQKVPIEAGVGLVGVFFGSLLTALTAWLTNRASERQRVLQLLHDEKVNKQRVQIERLEDLYVLVCKWGEYLFRDFSKMKSFVEGHITYSEYGDFFQAEYKEAYDFGRVQMLVNVYGKCALDAYNSLEIARDKVIEVRGKINSALLNGDAVTQFIDPLEGTQYYMMVEFKKFKEAIVGAINKI